MSKRQIINRIESIMRSAKSIEGRNFVPIPESIKRDLERESISSLQNDLAYAKNHLDEIRLRQLLRRRYRVAA